MRRSMAKRLAERRWGERVSQIYRPCFGRVMVRLSIWIHLTLPPALLMLQMEVSRLVARSITRIFGRVPPHQVLTCKNLKTVPLFRKRGRARTGLVAAVIKLSGVLFSLR